MEGTGPPLVTPFDADGEVDEPALRRLVDWVEERGVDFITPCGSNSEAELMTAAERAHVVEVVCEAADVPVLAGTGSPGFEETREATARAAAAGADAALVVTPFYYSHDEETLEAYYRDLADVADIPIYLYSVPAYTGTKLSPELVGRLADHPNIAGMKDSSGDIEAFTLERRATADADFDLFVGSGSVLAPALDAGADGGVLALSNVAPAAAAEIYERHRSGDREGAQALNADLVALNKAITAKHSIPGLKYAMRQRDAPAGRVRRPHRPVEDPDVQAELKDLVADL
ncbi:MAG: dihydrodipicolinate synthase family protein [Haloferacaceae archaeon]